MKKLKKAAAGVLTLALSFSIVGTSVAPTFANDIGKNLEECQKAVTKAQEKYDAAETAYDNGAVKFLESKDSYSVRKGIRSEGKDAFSGSIYRKVFLRKKESGFLYRKRLRKG